MAQIITRETPKKKKPKNAQPKGTIKKKELVPLIHGS